MDDSSSRPQFSVNTVSQNGLTLNIEKIIYQKVKIKFKACCYKRQCLQIT